MRVGWLGDVPSGIRTHNLLATGGRAGFSPTADCAPGFAGQSESWEFVAVGPGCRPLRKRRACRLGRPLLLPTAVHQPLDGEHVIDSRKVLAGSSSQT